VIKGWAEFEDAKTCIVQTDDGEIRITAEHVILATGSEPVELPFLPFGGDVISSTEALSLSEVAQEAGRRRRRLYRAGAGHRLSQAGRRSRHRRNGRAYPAAL
jgi:hypothetical protein